MTPPRPGMQMPKWLLYGLIAKGAVVIVVTLAVVIYVNFA